jgi:hypothetical protein
MFRGRVVAEFPGGADVKAIGLAMAGVPAGAAA